MSHALGVREGGRACFSAVTETFRCGACLVFAFGLFASDVAFANSDSDLPGGAYYARARAAEDRRAYADAADAYLASSKQPGPLQPYAQVRHAICLARSGQGATGLALLNTLLATGDDGPWKRMAAVEAVDVAVNTLPPAQAVQYVDALLSINRRLWWIDPHRRKSADLLLTKPEYRSQGFDLLHQLTTNGRYSWIRNEAGSDLMASVDPAHRLAAAQNMVDQRRFREAGTLLTSISDVVRNDPEYLPQWKFLNGHTLIGLGRGQEGRALFEELGNDHPNTAWARKGLETVAQFMIASQKGAHGNDLVEEMVRRYPGTEELASVLWSYARRLAEQRDYQGAVLNYLRLVETCPDVSRAGDALYEAAQIKQLTRATGAAMELYQQLLETYPWHAKAPEAGYLCGQLSEALNDADSAKNAYGIAMSSRLGDFFAHRSSEKLHLIDSTRGDVGHNLRVNGSESFVRPVPQRLPATGPAMSRWSHEPWMARLRFFGERGMDEAEWEALYLAEQLEAAPRSGMLYQVLADAGVAATAQDLMSENGWGLQEGRATVGRLLVMFPRPYWQLVESISAETGVDPYLLLAIARQESTFRPKIGSSAGAQGVMQLMPGTAKWLAQTNDNIAHSDAEKLHDPSSSLKLGAYYLRDMIARSNGNLVYALASYNAGPGNLDKWRRGDRTKNLEEFVENIPFDETRNYVKRVLGNYAAYHSLYGASGS